MDADVIVIGVGGMGAAACWHLARRGVKVLGLEQHDIAHSFGSSHGESRLIRKAYFEHPDYVPLLDRAYELWDEIEFLTGRRLFHRTGLVIFGPPEGKILEGIRTSVREYGVEVRELDEAEASAFCPFFRVPRGFLGILEPDAGYLEVENAVRTHVELARAAGATINGNVAVEDWDVIPSGVRVRTNLGTFEAKRLVLCPGAWAPKLLKWPSALPLVVHRVPLFWFPQPATEREDLPCFGFDMPYGFCYGFRPTARGLKVAPHVPGRVVDDPSQLDRDLDPADRDFIERFVAECLPEVEPTPSVHATCMYTMTPDEHFLIDLHPVASSVVVAAGFSGHGFKFASVVGEILADLSLEGGTALPCAFLQSRWR